MQTVHPNRPPKPSTQTVHPNRPPKQEYYANTGALVRAAKNARKGKAVGCSVVEAFGKNVKPRVCGEGLASCRACCIRCP